MGRSLSPYEMRTMMVAEQIYQLTQAQATAPGGLQTWNEAHPNGAKAIGRAADAAQELGLLKNE